MSSVMTTDTWSDDDTQRTTGHRPRPAILMLLLMLVGIAVSACASAEEAANLTDLNDVRAAVGLGALVRTPELDAKAKAHADLMASQGTIFHSADLASSVPAGWQSIGENVALAGSIDQAQRALEASPGHYANMVNPAFTQVGIGVTVSNGTTYVVQVFVSR